MPVGTDGFAANKEIKEIKEFCAFNVLSLLNTIEDIKMYYMAINKFHG